MNYRLPSSRPTVRRSEAGMAAILITMVTMVVVSLIVLGFAAISRREQGQSLDRQLSTQAFYAAETGVEDAKRVIQDALRQGKAVPAKTKCTTVDDSGYTPNYPVGADTILNAADNVSYTCLLVDPTPASLVYTGLSDDSQVVALNATDTIDQIDITWTPTSAPSGSPASCPDSTDKSFSPATKWNCGYGVLRTDLVPSDGALTRSDLQNTTMTSFFEPTKNSNAGEISYTGARNKPNITAANCSVGSYGQCKMTIKDLESHKSFRMRLMSLYKQSDVTIVGYHAGSKVKLNGSQAMVDVTGKATDVLRRIQVRLPLTGGSSNGPNYAVQSNGSLCKRFVTTPSYFSIPGDIRDPDSTNDMCKATISGSL